MGRHFEHDFVRVQLREILGDLALAEGVIECVIDDFRSDPEPGGPIPVDGQCRRGARDLLVRRDVAQHRQAAKLGEDLRRPLVKFGEIGALDLY